MTESKIKSKINKFTSNKLAFGSLIIITVLGILSVLIPLIWPTPYDLIRWDKLNSPPQLNSGLIFGTDQNGRDLFIRTFYGLQISLSIAIISGVITTAIGAIYGSVSGFIGGRLDAIAMSTVEIVIGVPNIFIILIVVSIFGSSYGMTIFILSIVSWPGLARVIRNQTLTIKNRDFILAAQAMGLTKWQIIVKHIVPNMYGIILADISFTIPGLVLTEAAMSFLGLGVNEPEPSLGKLINNGVNVLGEMPWMTLFPAIALGTTLMCCAFIADGLKEAFDPKSNLL